VTIAIRASRNSRGERSTERDGPGKGGGGVVRMAICSAVSGGAENGNGGGIVVGVIGGVACSIMRP
jgi:hypothetical protein